MIMPGIATKTPRHRVHQEFIFNDLFLVLPIAIGICAFGPGKK